MQDKLAEFEKMVRAHDLTFQFSDDHSYWVRGQATLKAIQEAAKELPAEDVERIWNANVDRKLADFARKDFYWRRG